MKAIRFYDRLSQNETSTIDDLFEQKLLGRWMLRLPQEIEVEHIYLNNFPINRGQYLLGNRYGKWEVIQADSSKIHGEIFQQGIPDDDIAVNFSAIAQEMNNAKNWEMLGDISPLMRNLEEQINFTQSEQYMKKRLPYLEEVCRNPVVHLTQEIRKLPVSRARKVPQKAINYLAGHSEDWLHRSFSRPIPKHILCEVKDDLWTIYENCVAAELVDRLLRKLRRRLNKLSKIKKFIEILEQILQSGGLSEGNYRSYHRLYELCGKAYQQNFLSKEDSEIQKTIQQLQHWQKKIVCLTVSVLYKSIPIPKKKGLGTSLKKTNLFVHHKDYKYVRLLWESLKETVKPDERVFDEQNQLIHNFNWYACLTVIRALRDLKFGGNFKGEPFQNGTTIPLHSDVFGDIILILNEDETILLEFRSPFSSKIRFIPLVTDINMAGFSENLDSLKQLIVDNSSGTVYQESKILYFWNVESSDNIHDSPTYKNGDSKNPGWIPINPMDVYSIEKVARSILYWLLTSMSRTYPPADIDISEFPGEIKFKLSKLSKNGFCEFKNSSISILKPLTTTNQQLLESILSPISADNQKRIQRLEEFREKLGNDKIIRGDVRNEGAEAERSERLLSRFRTNIKIASDKIVQLCFCPICLMPYSVQYWEVRDNQCFEFHCCNSECRTIWGRRKCSKGHNVLYLQLDKLGGILANRKHLSIHDYIHLLGRDFLAEPVLGEDGRIRWTCPICGELT